jgi:G3E family GTPase
MTPLVIIVGFLGAGKTTYLKNLLPQLVNVGIEPHVIINDYENASVDAELFAGLIKNITPISGSCVCCGSRDQLLESLKGFHHEPNRVVIIETNGTTDSEELIEMLTLAPELEQFSPPIQISIIDGKRWQKRFWHNSLELEQAKTANYLFISRMKELDETRCLKIEESLQRHTLSQNRMNPGEFAPVLKKMSDDLAGIARRSELAGTKRSRNEYRVVSNQPLVFGHHNHSAHHFASFQINLPNRVAKASLVKFLGELPNTVIRAKGVVRLADPGDEYFVFQKVDRFESTQFFPIRKPAGENPCLAIFIGPAIPEPEVRASAEKLLF